VLELPSGRIDAQAPLERYGIDSILAMRFTTHLEKTFGMLSKTLFFEYQSVAALAGYFVRKHPQALRKAIGLEAPAATAAPNAQKAAGTTVQPRRSRDRAAARAFGAKAQGATEIAIVGIAGRYPEAANPEAFWENLKQGRDCIREIPPERWDHSRYFDTDRNRLGGSYSKWGGFLEDVDRFDPALFGITPLEAELMDPQERLFLETVWETLEEAGYGRQALAGSRTGVFVGVMWGHYELLGAEAIGQANGALPNSSHASIANRISYLFDLHGPSIALDTMCSSSLTAIHLACQAIRNGDIEAAIAGGVNLSLHPVKYLALSQGKFASSDGRCRSFGEGGDGYVPGEGVGAVLLKPLHEAQRDGDHVYAVIKASAINHGGKTNGYTVPNPTAQGDLIREALERAGIDPATLGYVEAHGTGTSLGDPIEIAGLLRAFEPWNLQPQSCAIGSVKSNIGHLESAAGIAALTKVLLQMKHGMLVPSLHADTLNPHIDFRSSPFRVQTRLEPWQRAAEHPRRAAVSSFGAGGSNAHLILEEYVDVPVSGRQSNAAQVLVFSARDAAGLARVIRRFVTFLGQTEVLSLQDCAYTLQVGRTPLNVRLAVVASSAQELARKLDRWLEASADREPASGAAAVEADELFYANVQRAQAIAGVLLSGEAGGAFVRQLVAGRELAKIARLWTLGVAIDWSALHANGRPRRLSLPTYPFARERYWIASPAAPASPPPSQDAGVAGQAVRPASAPEAAGKRRVLYRPHWKAAALSCPSGALKGPVWVLDADEDLVLALRERLSGDVGRSPVIWVRPGTAYEATSSSAFAVRDRDAQDFARLVGELKARQLLPRLVIHRGSRHADTQGEASGRSGLHAMFHLCKALMLEKHQAPCELLSVFESDATNCSVPDVALGGFFRTLALENPGYRGKTLDLRRTTADAVPVADIAQLIVNEALDAQWDAQEVRYLCGQDANGRTFLRHTRTWAAYPSGEAREALPLRTQGVYIVTGGLGGLGSIVSEALACRYRARLVLVGRSAIDERLQAKLEKLRRQGGEVHYVRADVSRRDDVERVVREAKERFATIDGVIHSAGLNRDAFILRKTAEQIDEVLAAKVAGALHLDEATRGEALDLFVMFSSIAGALGSVGQCDYAYANRFLDALAEQREALKQAGRRSGRSLSIDWPFWDQGGMSMAARDLELSEQVTGMAALPTDEGLQCWAEVLASELCQALVLYGDAARLESFIGLRPPQPARVEAQAPAPGPNLSGDLRGRVESYLKGLIAAVTKLDADRIESHERLEALGVDSLMINSFNVLLERDLGPQPKTLLYEYETVFELASYLMEHAKQALVRHLGLRQTASEGSAATAAAVAAPASLPVETGQHAPAPAAGTTEALAPTDESEAIAIIGLHGRFPRSQDLDAYWENLKRGADLVDLVPADRWDCEALYDADPQAAAKGSIYCKWGGFIEDHDRFDAEFFNIPAGHAKVMDPQERLFLESAWSAIEDAGYTRDTLRKRFGRDKSAHVGVFVGVTTNSYQLLQAQEWNRGNMATPASLPWSIANRVSYFFNFKGPSMPVDTACSSALVAVQLACDSLRRNECQLALAGGVNLYCHPSKFHSLCLTGALARHGRCRSFGAGDDGYVPAEGVGALLLKPLKKAIADRDPIHAVIRAAAVEHSGRSNGYSAPNPNAQAGLIARVLEQAGIGPEAVGYVEAHGTGTQLGDGIEIAALTQAMRLQTSRRQFCAIGSVKSNIGHAESAAGIAAIAKVVLQLKHRQLVPTLHCDPVNEGIEFAKSPFYLQRELSAWECPPQERRRALINSFGAGGVNACAVVEEYSEPEARNEASNEAQSPEQGKYLFLLSARNGTQLREYAARMRDYLSRSGNEVRLADLCYTLQVGREAHSQRLATVFSSREELIERLSLVSRQQADARVLQGTVASRKRERNAAGGRPKGEIGAMLRAREVEGLAQAWICGQDIDWERMYAGDDVRRLHLPPYPFAKERHWVSEAPAKPAGTSGRGGRHERALHPLISYNSSDLDGVSFTSLLSDEAFYATDHRVIGESIFPGAGLLEIACMAGNIAGQARVSGIRDAVWIQPIGFQGGGQEIRTFLKRIGEDTEYTVTSVNEYDETVVHAEGRLVFGEPSSAHAGDAQPLDLEELRARCPRQLDGAAYYEALRQHGLEYGPAFRTLHSIHSSERCALARLQLPDALLRGFEQFLLHPALIDGALQVVGAMAAGSEPSPGEGPYLPFALDELEIFQPLPPQCYVYAEASEPDPRAPELRRFHIRLLNEQGQVLVRLGNLVGRAAAGRLAPAPGAATAPSRL
jgi:polyketide synthase PksL